MRQKKEIAEMLNNPNQPPPLIKKVDVITQVEKVNTDLAENEIKFSFKPSKDMITRGVGYVKYYFRMTDSAEPIK